MLQVLYVSTLAIYTPDDFEGSISMANDTSTKFYTMKVYLHYCLEQYHGVAVITTAQLHSLKPELRFCSGSDTARGESEMRDSKDL